MQFTRSCSTALSLGDVILVEVPYIQGPGAKVRPAIVVLYTGGLDFVAVPVTSRPRASSFDLGLADWHGAGLNVPSTARIHKLSVLPKASVRRALGHLAATDCTTLVRLI